MAGSLVKYTTNTAIKPKTADELAAIYGIKNKEADYASALGAATDAKFGMWDTQMKGIRDQQLTDYASQFSQYQNYQRQNRQNALRSGLSRGSAIAQEVMSQVQNQAYGAQNQTQYQQQLADIAAQKGAQVGADKFNAFDMANKTNMELAGISTTQQQTETAGQAGYQAYLGDLAQAAATRANADATTYAADQGNLLFKETLGVLGEENRDLAIAVGKGDLTIAEAKAKALNADGLPKFGKSGQMYTKPDGTRWVNVKGIWAPLTSKTTPSIPNTVSPTSNNNLNPMYGVGFNYYDKQNN